MTALTAKLPQRRTPLEFEDSKSDQQDSIKLSAEKSGRPAAIPASTCLDDIAINPRHPQQNTFHMNRGITISSEFDSGNLSRCVQSDSDYKHFTCYMSGDGLPYTNVGHYRTWFYFNVKGVQNGDTCTFAIKGMA